MMLLFKELGSNGKKFLTYLLLYRGLSILNISALYTGENKMLQKKSIFVGIFTISLLAIGGYFAWDYRLQYTKSSPLPTYFHYSVADISSLNNLKPTDKITIDELKELDNIMFDLVS